MGIDELVVIDLPPGPEWVGLVTRLWLDEVPFLPELEGFGLVTVEALACGTPAARRSWRTPPR